MPDLTLDGRALHVAAGTSVAAALALGGDGSSRTSVSGQRRLACQTLCRDGMHVETRP